MSLVSPRVIRGNRGDIASRYGILQSLHAAGLEISAVFAARDSHVPEILRPRILRYGPLYNLWPGLRGLTALWRARAVLWTGGLDLQDDSSLIKLVHTWLVFLSYRLIGLKILLILQGAGPLRTTVGRFLARRVLGLVELALVRDTGSQHLLRELAGPERVQLAADGIFLDGPPTSARARRAEGPPVIGLNIRMWFHFASSWVPYGLARDRYRARAAGRMTVLLAAFERTVAHLRARYGARIVLVSMYEPDIEPWEDDLPLLRELKARFAGDPEVVLCDEDLSIEHLFSLFEGFDLMIGMRLHSTLLALRVGVPAIHVAYTLKGRDIYADLGLADWVVDVQDLLGPGDALIRRVDAVLADSGRFDRVRAAVEPLVRANRDKLVNTVRQAGLS